MLNLPLAEIQLLEEQEAGLEDQIHHHFIIETLITCHAPTLGKA